MIEADSTGARILRAASNGARPAPPEPDPHGHLLGLRPIRDIAAEVDAAPRSVWLYNGLWPADAHGVIAALWKVGKTWLILDAAVSTASGTPWLGLFAAGRQGPVVLFLGEGGARKMTRRGRAIAAARGLVWDDLPIVMAERAPRLRESSHINALTLELDRHPAVLVVIDPLYLAAAGAQGSQLYEMAAVLEPVQATCQHAGAALVVAHHHNRDSARKGSERMSGAGPAEWGRVLLSVEQVTATRHPTTGATDVVLRLHCEGDEIAGGDHLVRRTVWAEDDGDIASPLHYRVEPVDLNAAPTGEANCAEAVAAWFVAHPDLELAQHQILSQTRAYWVVHGLPTFRDRAVAEALATLVSRQVLVRRYGPRNSRLFSLNDRAPVEGPK